MLRIKKGFTLIELLVVIGVLAVISAGVVALINPQEKLRQANDAKIMSDIGQLSSGFQSFAAQQFDGSYPCQTAVAACPNPAQSGTAAIGPAGSQELNNVPTLPNGGAYTYVSNPVSARPVTQMVVYGQLTSNKYIARCNGTTPYWFYNTTNDRVCGFCGAAAPAVATVCTANF